MADPAHTQHFACSRCAHRQSEDTACGGCGNAVVLDLRDTSSRGRLYQADAEHIKKGHTRIIGGGVVAGLVLTSLYGLITVGNPLPIGLGYMAVSFAAALVCIGALETFYKPTSRYPYLADYEKTMPASDSPSDGPAVFEP